MSPSEIAEMDERRRDFIRKSDEAAKRGDSQDSNSYKVAAEELERIILADLAIA